MNRRGFLGALSTLAAGLVLDPERLLWVPGAKTIFLPPVERFSGNRFITPQWVTRDVLATYQNQLKIHRFVTKDGHFGYFRG